MGILSSFNKKFPGKDSDWLSLSHMPIPEPITVARGTLVDQVGEDILSRNGCREKQ